MSRTDPAPREESTRIGTDPGHLEAMLTAASDRENAASLSPVVVSGMAMDSLAVIERLQRDLSEARRDAHEERQRSDDYRAALEEALRERDEAADKLEACLRWAREFAPDHPDLKAEQLPTTVVEVEREELRQAASQMVAEALAVVRWARSTTLASQFGQLNNAAGNLRAALPPSPQEEG